MKKSLSNPNNCFPHQYQTRQRYNLFYNLQTFKLKIVYLNKKKLWQNQKLEREWVQDLQNHQNRKQRNSNV